MIQVTNIQDLKTAVNQNGKKVITMNNNDILIMKMKEFEEICNYISNKLKNIDVS